MSYLVNKVNDVEPVNEDIAVSKTISDYMTDMPQDGQAAFKSAQGWKPAFMSADADPLNFCYSAHSFFPFTVDYGANPYRYYTLTNWAYTFPNIAPNGVVQLDSSYASPIIASMPPSPYYFSNIINNGITLQTGTYLIRFIPAIDAGFAVWRIYHTNTSNGDSQYLGNHLYHNALSKTGGHAIGILNASEARKVYLRALAVGGAYGMYAQATYRFSIQIQRIG